MKFEVRRGADIIMQTYQDSCIPLRHERDILRKAGYKLYIDGKQYVENKQKKVSAQESLDVPLEGQISFWNERVCAVE